MGELKGCWATPSAVAPQAPPASCPSPAPSYSYTSWGLGALSSPASAVLLQDAAAKDGAHWSQPVLTNGAAAGPTRDLGNATDWHPFLFVLSWTWVFRAPRFSCAACVFGERLRRQNWPYFLRIIWEPREVPKLNLTGQNLAARLWGCSKPGGTGAALVGFLLELGPGREPRDGAHL